MTTETMTYRQLMEMSHEAADPTIKYRHAKHTRLLHAISFALKSCMEEERWDEEFTFPTVCYEY